MTDLLTIETLAPAVTMPQGPFLVLFLLVFVGGALLFVTLVSLLILARRRDARRRDLRARQSSPSDRRTSGKPG